MPAHTKLFTTSALIEFAAGLPLIVLPALFIWLLIGVREPSAEMLIICRVTGSALLALALACWFARKDHGSSSRRGLLFAMLIYNSGACLTLSYAGLVLQMVGIALWPVVLLHAAMAAWLIIKIRE